MNIKRWIALGVAITLFIFSVIFSLVMNLLFNGSSFFTTVTNEYSEVILSEGSLDEKIVVLHVDGVIQDIPQESGLFATEGYNHQSFLGMLDQAKNDGTVKGIVIEVNSPGGGTNESAEIYHKIKEVQKETDKPIYVSMGTMAASGGYYISAPADKIFASEETLTGSLGVIMQSVNYAGLAEKYGVKFETIKSGPHKDIMSPTREMTEEEREILQSMIDNSYKKFVQIISEGRNMKKADVLKIADGRVYDGVQAKKLNLIDEFGYLEDAILDMTETYNLEDAQVVEYEDYYSFGSLFGMSTFMKQDEFGKIQSLIEKTNSPRMMYLYAE